jgi:hypothetical protein
MPAETTTGPRRAPHAHRPIAPGGYETRSVSFIVG